MATEREVKLVLSVATRGSEAVKGLFNATAGPSLMASASAASLKGIGEQLARTREQADALRASLHPEIIREMAKSELALEAARKAQLSALAAAKNALQPQGPGAFGQFFTRYSGGQGIAGAATHAAQSFSGGGLVGMATSAIGSAGPYGQAVVAAAGALGTLKDQAIAFAAKANPSVVERYSAAWDNLQAVIGQRAIPFVELLTGVVQSMGDVLQTILPDVNEVGGALDPLKDSLKDLRTIASDMAPLLRVGLIQELHKLAMVIKLVTLAIKLSPLGLTGTGQDNLKTSLGAAAGQAHFMSLTALGEKAQLAVMGAGVRDTQERTADATETLAGTTLDIYNWLRKKKEEIRAAGNAALDAVLPGGRATRQLGEVALDYFMPGG